MGLKEKIGFYLDRHDYDGLLVMLQKLSNSELRRAERIVREEILACMDNSSYWKTFRFFVLFRPQGYLPCISSIKHLADDDSLDFNNEDVAAISETLSEENISKLIGMAVAHLNSVEQITSLFDAFKFHNDSSCASVLIKQNKPVCYYMLFTTLKRHSDRKLCVSCVKYLLHRQTDMAYNMASILINYFGLHEIKGHLSLRIEPYEISYIDKSVENFFYMLEGKRPRVK